jgi:Na+-driven multidrug efflux pump
MHVEPKWALLKELFTLAVPVFLGSVGWFIVNIFSLSLVGTTGTTSELAALGLGNVFVNVFGGSMLRGFAGALRTLSSHAYGAKEMMLVGEHGRRATLILLALMLPISSCCWYAGDIAIALGQDQEIAALLSQFTRNRILGLFFYSLYLVKVGTLNIMGQTKPGMWVLRQQSFFLYLISIVLLGDFRLCRDCNATRLLFHFSFAMGCAWGCRGADES